MAKKEKEFNFKLYAVVVFFAITAALVAITYSTYVSRYTAFHPERVAKSYVNTIVQTGDGYNAYKNALVSKSTKYGDFIRKYYMYPIIYRDADYSPENGTDGLNGFNDDSFKGEKTLNDDGSLAGKVIEQMYPFYESLIKENGWDNYELIFSSYLKQLVDVRKEIFGDDYITDEIMFTALESNVRTYGENLTGTEDQFDENTGLQTSFKSEGVYQKAYGEDYKLISSVDDGTDISLEEYLKTANTELFDLSGIVSDDITAAKSYVVTVSNENETITKVNVTVVQIGKSWYVDCAKTDTSSLYTFYEMN